MVGAPAVTMMRSNGAASGRPAVPSPELMVTLAMPRSWRSESAWRASSGMAFDRPDVAGELGEDGGLVAGAGADLENPLGSGQGEGLRHQRHDVGLANGLAGTDWQGDIGPGAVAERRWNEAFARNAAERAKDALVMDALAA